MDISETYIKMCEKAEEIQRFAPYTYDSSGLRFRVVNNDWSGNTWLPRQDQLQEMIELPLKDKLYRFSLWALFHTTEFTSMGQLWFAFVMKEKYGKVWNGETW